MSWRIRMPIAVLVVSMLMVVVAAGAAQAATRYCPGEGTDCYGTRYADTIYDGPSSNYFEYIYGRPGGDVIRAGYYLYDYDVVYGGGGPDVIRARDDYDTGYYDYIYGGRGYDVCYVDYADIVSGCEEVIRR